jgi:hypothetical protein
MANLNDSRPAVVDCTFISNGAVYGGGVYNNAASPEVRNCSFVENSALEQGGGMYNKNGSDLTVVNCLFAGNETYYDGGAMYNHQSNPTITNCTVVGNLWDGIRNSYSSPSVRNSILWGNSPNQVFDLAGAMSVISYCTIQGGAPGHGNSDADPAFVAYNACCLPSAFGCEDSSCEAVVCAERPFCCSFGGWDSSCIALAEDLCGLVCQNDYRLQAGSPCIDAGHNYPIADLADTDLAGNPRFADDPATADGGCGVPVVVDMGPYEYQGDPGTITFADLNGDNVVGLDDFEALLNCWSSSDEPCCVADLDLDGTVGVADFLILLGNWG